MNNSRPSSLYSTLLSQLDSGHTKLPSIDTDTLQQLLIECNRLQHVAKQQSIHLSTQLRACFGGADDSTAVSELDDQQWYMNCLHIIHGTDIDELQQQQQSTSVQHEQYMLASKSVKTTHTSSKQTTPLSYPMSHISGKTAAPVNSLPASSQHSMGKQPVNQHVTSDRTAVSDANVYSKPRKRPGNNRSGGGGGSSVAHVDDDVTESDSSDTDDVLYVKRDKPRRRRNKEDDKQYDRSMQLQSFWSHIEQCMSFPTQSHVEALQMEHTDTQSDPMYQIPDINSSLSADLHVHTSVKAQQQQSKSKTTKRTDVLDDQTDTIPSLDTDMDGSVDMINGAALNSGAPVDTAGRSVGQSQGTYVGGGKKTTGNGSVSNKSASKDLRIVGIHDNKIKRQVNELDRVLADAMGQNVNKTYSYTRHNIAQRLLSVFVHDSAAPPTTFNPFAFTRLLANHTTGKSKVKRKKSDNVDNIGFDERVRMELQALQLLPDNADTVLRRRQDDTISTELRRYQAKLKQARKSSAQHKIRLLPLSTQLMPRAHVYTGLHDIQGRVNRLGKTKRKQPVDESQIAATLAQYDEYKRQHGTRSVITGYYVDHQWQRGIPDVVARKQPPAPSYWQALLGIPDPYASDQPIKTEQNNVSYSPISTQPTVNKSISPVPAHVPLATPQLHVPLQPPSLPPPMQSHPVAQPPANMTPMYPTPHQLSHRVSTPSPSLHVSCTPADRGTASPMPPVDNTSDDSVMRDLLSSSAGNEINWLTAPSIGKLHSESIVSDLDLGFDPF